MTGGDRSRRPRRRFAHPAADPRPTQHHHLAKDHPTVAGELGFPMDCDNPYDIDWVWLQ